MTNACFKPTQARITAAIAVVTAFILQVGTASSFAQQAERTQPRLRVRVEPTQDRWITFGDGNRVQHGFEVSPLLDYYLFHSDAFVVQHVPQVRTQDASLNLEDDLIERLGGELGQQVAKDILIRSGRIEQQSSGGDLLHVIVRPRVETLLYASGLRSNRLVYGFSPDRLDPFNEGRPGAIDNEFIEKNSSAANPSCKPVDLLNDQVRSVGFGPWAGNYGANFDEGAEFFIAGYGLGFRYKKFTVKSEVVFDLEFPEMGQKTSLRQVLTGGGTDVMVAVTYQGIYGAIEAQRRKTLRKALHELLPSIVQEVRNHLGKTPWSTRVMESNGSQLLVRGGFAEGLETGMALYTESGDQVVLSQIGQGMSVGLIQNPAQIQAGTRLYAHNNGPQVQRLAVEQTQQREVKLFANRSTEESAADALDSNGKCSAVKKPSFFERLLNSAFLAYGYYRYFQVLDQPNRQPAAQAQLAGLRKVAIVSTGISPKEKKLEAVLDSSGFDFLSWDNRPADDVGAGTAEALHLMEKLDVAVKLVPIRVIGPYGTTHSSAIYQALLHLSTRADVDAVVIPFAPRIESKALAMGIEKITQSGKSVFVSSELKGVVGSRVLRLDAARSDKEHSVFGTKGRVSPTARGVLEGAATWMNKNWKIEQ